ncbi:MAG: AAA family ATPase, partial [Casimicrobiaceae bacterium]
ERVTGAPAEVTAVVTTGELGALQRRCRSGYVDPVLVQYAVRLTSATREPERYGVHEVAKYLSFGASPRASIHLIEAARALGFLRGRDYLLPEDVRDVAPDVLRHRLVLSYEALADEVTPDDLVRRVMQAIAAPEKLLESRARAAAQG